MGRPSFLFRRDYSAFPGLPTRTLSMDVLNYSILFYDTAYRKLVSIPSWTMEPVVSSYPDSTAILDVVGTEEAIAMARSVAAGNATLGIFADWIEDDPTSRVRKLTKHHAEKVHRLDDDLLTHMLAVMRSHRPVRRRSKAKSEGK